MDNYKEGEVVNVEIKNGIPHSERRSEFPFIETLTLSKYIPEMKVTREKIDRHRDEIETRTGVFNWRFQDGRYVPIHRLTNDELRTISTHCERKMHGLQTYIEVLFDQMCAWQYRLEKIGNEADLREYTLPEYNPEKDRYSKARKNQEELSN